MGMDDFLKKYRAFLEAKCEVAQDQGFIVYAPEVNPILKPHQNDSVRWLVRGGRRALFSSFGLGKTVTQLEAVRLTMKHSGEEYGLIVAPLGVRQEFQRDAIECLGWEKAPRFIRRNEEIDGPGIYITNYESVRDGKLDPARFGVTTLDEADVLRGFGGTKTFREFMVRFESVRFRYVATATPDPNEYIELLAYAAYLGVMDVGQAKTRFFKRNSEKADELTIHSHKEREFWLWVASWALFLQKPSDLGYSDEGYDLPELDFRTHEVAVDHSAAPPNKHGQGQIFRGGVSGVVEASREKRDSLQQRVEKMSELLGERPGEHVLLWHDLEDERRAIEKAVPGVVSVYGTQDLDEREQAIIDFSNGKFAALAAKPVIAGSGCNFQRHCAWAIFVGVGFKFKDFLQAIHRIYRFLQTKQVRVDVILAESERPVLVSLMEKWERHKEKVARMSAIIKQYGLSQEAMAAELTRTMGVERVEVRGQTYRLINNDTVEETHRMEEASVDMILTSIPFSTQYEYTPSYNDFGHTDSNDHFFEQLDFLTPNLLKVLKPGRTAAIHVKDRIVPGGMTNLGFQSVYPFHCRTIEHFVKHGFVYMGMKTIVTDVVRENNQTYRLSYTEMCKDATKIGVGMPEYLLLFRKPQSDTTKGYADDRVTKSKADFSLARWQVSAAGFDRSSGNRLMSTAELAQLDHQAIYKIWKAYTLSSVYDFEEHVRLGETLQAQAKLPTDFTLIPAHSQHPEVWTDVTRMRTLNGAQQSKGREMHLCPLQFDIVDRAIRQYTEEGETIYDPFGGLMTVPYRAVHLRRQAVACELNPKYFLDGCMYASSAEMKMTTPTLFDTLPQAVEESVPA